MKLIAGKVNFAKRNEDCNSGKEDCKDWRGMRRAYGRVWDMANPPKGEVSLRFQVSGSYGFMKWVQLKAALPSDWKAGAIYDTTLQLS